jgi:hypothetical protein
MLFAPILERVQASQKSSDELLLEIMDLHGELVTNETFLAQAKMLGAYLEAAHEFEEAKKASVYEKVLKILLEIKDVRVQPSSRAEQSKSDAERRPPEKESQETKTVYKPGAAALEIFKSDSLDNIPNLPLIRTFWNRDLTYLGGFLLPDRATEIGQGAYYVARFSFYYHAKQPGKYGFNVQMRRQYSGMHQTCKLAIGRVEVLRLTEWPDKDEAVSQGICDLKEGFYTFEFSLFSRVDDSYEPRYDKEINRTPRRLDASFCVRILTPDAIDAVPVTKDMMLLKADQKKAAQVDQAEKAKGKSIPYIDY